MRRTVGLVVLLAVACSSDHPAFVGGETNGGTRGVSHAGTTGAAPDDGAAGERAAGGSGGRADSNSGGSAGESEPNADDAGAPNTDLGTFNPWDVYIFGTLSPGGSGSDAIALWSNPNYYVGGFAQTHGDDARLLNGSLLYRANRNGHSGQSIFQFVPDFMSSLSVSALKYPEKSEANDIALKTPPCQDETANFLTSPDGRLIYECADDTWYEDGTPLWDHKELGYDLLAFGYDGLVLLDSNLTVMDLATGQRQTPDGFEQVLSIAAVRAVKGGFHVVLRVGTDGDERELWSVSSHAVAKKLGVFPAWPDGVDQLGFSSRLSAWDELFEEGRGPQPAHGEADDLIVLRTIDGTSAIVYTEASQPRVQLHGSQLFTGP